MRFFTIFITTLFFAFNATAQVTSSNKVLEAVFDEKDKENWAKALVLAKPTGPIAMDLVVWDKLRAGDGTFEETQVFLQRHSDWPGLPYLRKRSEQTILVNAAPVSVIRFFQDQAPQTAIGSLRYAQALKALGQRSKAIAQAQLGWVTFLSTEEVDKEFFAAFGSYLKQSHSARLDMLLWRDARLAAKRMLPKVSAEYEVLARARLALQTDAKSRAKLLSEIPKNLRNDPGLAYDLFRWHLARKQTNKAIALMVKQSSSALSLGKPTRWFSARSKLARDLLWDGEYSSAYQIAANHHLESGSDYAELEWLAGFISLRKLNRPGPALGHFKRHGRNVGTAISLGRTNYWQGRAYDAMGEKKEAQLAYREGAKYQTSFYGLLSAEAGNIDMQASLTGLRQDKDWRQSSFVNSSVLRAGLLLMNGDRARYGVRFLTHLAEGLSPSEMGQLASMAEEIKRPYLQLMLGKRAARYGVMLERHFYPFNNVSKNTGSIAPELVLAIARRESEFYPGAISGAGALGLMQIMPETAKEMAGNLRLRYSRPRMLKDAAYNAILGVSYLKELTEEFGNSPVHIAAAYNAGPSRARRWTQQLGDPRLGQIDVVDWIEQIPFSETRNYVMRVTESLPNYRSRLSGQTAKINFRSELRGDYVPLAPPLAPAVSFRPVSRPRS